MVRMTNYGNQFLYVVPKRAMALRKIYYVSSKSLPGSAAEQPRRHKRERARTAYAGADEFPVARTADSPGPARKSGPARRRRTFGTLRKINTIEWFRGSHEARMPPDRPQSVFMQSRCKTAVALLLESLRHDGRLSEPSAAPAVPQKYGKTAAERSRGGKKLTPA